MKFIDGCLRPWSADEDDGISQCCGIDDFAWFANIVRLKAGSRVRNDKVTIDAKLITRADTRRCAERLMPSFLIFRHAHWLLPALKQFDQARGGRPEIEHDALRGDEGAMSAWLLRGAKNFDQWFLVCCVGMALNPLAELGKPARK